MRVDIEHLNYYRKFSTILITLQRSELLRENSFTLLFLILNFHFMGKQHNDFILTNKRRKEL